MNAKLAYLIMQRRKLSEHYDNEDYEQKYLVQEVYPSISAAAFRGYSNALIVGKLNDTIVKILEKSGYVVRMEHGSISTSIEWGKQVLIDKDGKTTIVSPTDYNEARALYHKRQLEEAERTHLP